MFNKFIVLNQPTKIFIKKFHHCSCCNVKLICYEYKKCFNDNITIINNNFYNSCCNVNNNVNNNLIVPSQNDISNGSQNDISNGVKSHNDIGDGLKFHYCTSCNVGLWCYKHKKCFCKNW